MIESSFLAILVTLLAYQIGLVLKKQFKINALLVGIILVGVFVLVSGMEVHDYQQQTSYISFLLTPATICLAIPLYEQWNLLKTHWQAIVSGIIAGVLSSLMGIGLMGTLFNLSHQELVSLLPKSITTAIGMGVSEELGGLVSLTVGAIIITGVLGAVLAPFVLHVFAIKNPIAKGVGIGSAAHAIGTSKAMELGEVEGAMSSLAIVIAGLMTVLLAPIFGSFL